MNMIPLFVNVGGKVGEVRVEVAEVDLFGHIPYRIDLRAVDALNPVGTNLYIFSSKVLLADASPDAVGCLQDQKIFNSSI